MRQAHRPGRQRFRKRAGWWVATFVFLLLAVFTLTGKNGAVQTLRLRAIRADLAGQVRTIAEENRTLRAELASLRSESPEAIEQRAREDLGMVRPGEIRIDFKDPAAPKR